MFRLSGVRPRLLTSQKHLRSFRGVSLPLEGDDLFKLGCGFVFALHVLGAFLFLREYVKRKHWSRLWGSKACGLFVLTVKELLSQTEGCFSPHSLPPGLERGRAIAFVCVLVTNWLPSSISERLIACGHLIKHCMLCEVCTLFFFLC